jgi:ankyrin repeat protein
LVAAGAPLNVLSKRGQSPLTFAVNTGSEELVAAMLGAGADVNLAGNGEFSMDPLYFAAQNVSLNIVKMLLHAGANPEHRSLDVKATPLLVACNQPNCTEVLKTLVAAGASYQDTDGYGYGALEHAVYSDDPAVFHFLIDQGVKWQTVTAFPDYSPLIVAVIHDKRESVRTLLDLGMYNSRALAEAKDPEIKALLEDKARDKGDRVADDEELWPSICSDAQNGSTRAEAHVARGGNVNYSSQTWTPLILALKSHNRELVKWLLARGADPHKNPISFRVDPYGELIDGSRSRDWEKGKLLDDDVAECSRMLLQAKAGPPWSAYVFEAATNGWAKTVAVFLEAGVSRDELLKRLADTPAQSMPDDRRAEILRIIQQ